MKAFQLSLLFFEFLEFGGEPGSRMGEGDRFRSHGSKFVEGDRQ